MYFRIRNPIYLKVSECIKELLRRHECVIIPNFGAFLVKSSPAYYERILNAIRPPVSTIFFNSELKKNDDLLINTIVLNEEISYIAAENKVDQFVNEVSQTLIDRRSYILKGIGKIYMENDEIKFKTSQSEELNSDGFGLPTLFVSEINRKKQDKELIEKVIETQTKRVSPWATFFTVAASIIAILLGSSLYFLNNGTYEEKQLIQKSFIGSIFDLNSYENATDDSYLSSKLVEKSVIPSAEKKSPVFIETPNENISTRKEETKSESISEDQSKETELNNLDSTKEEDSAIVVTDSRNLKADFHVVIGMFNLSENAELAKQNAIDKGYKAYTIKGKKYYRVIIPFSSQQITWVAAQKEVRSNISNEAWVWETRYKTNR